MIKGDNFIIFSAWRVWKSNNPQYWSLKGYKFVRKNRAKYVISCLKYFGKERLPYID